MTARDSSSHRDSTFPGALIAALVLCFLSAFGSMPLLYWMIGFTLGVRGHGGHLAVAILVSVVFALAHALLVLGIVQRWAWTRWVYPVAPAVVIGVLGVVPPVLLVVAVPAIVLLLLWLPASDRWFRSTRAPRYPQSGAIPWTIRGSFVLALVAVATWAFAVWRMVEALLIYDAWPFALGVLALFVGCFILSVFVVVGVLCRRRWVRVVLPLTLACVAIVLLPSFGGWCALSGSVLAAVLLVVPASNRWFRGGPSRTASEFVARHPG